VAATVVALAPRAPAQPANHAALTCRVDPAVELISVIAMLGRDDADRTLLDHAYGLEVREHFARFADHPAVRRAAAIAATGLEDFVAQVGSRIGPLPALADREPFYAIGDGPVSVPRDTIRALAAAARDFARRTSFAEFYYAHTPFYRALCDHVLGDTALADAPARVEQFFGMRSAAYEIVLMPLVPRLGVAPPGVRAGPRATLTAYVGHAGVRDSQPMFRVFSS